MTTFLIIIGYVLNVLLNRLIYFQIQKINKDAYPNIAAIIACFCSLYGTFSLLIIWLITWFAILDFKSNQPKIEFFKYKPKNK